MRALQAAAGEYASYPAYARQFSLMGLEGECRQAAAAHASGRPEDVPDALVRAVALVGEPSMAELVGEYAMVYWLRISRATV